MHPVYPADAGNTLPRIGLEIIALVYPADAGTLNRHRLGVVLDRFIPLTRGTRAIPGEIEQHFGLSPLTREHRSTVRDMGNVPGLSR